MEGVVRAPSAFSITLAVEPSITATQEFVVPKSMPITLLIKELPYLLHFRGLSTKISSITPTLLII
jgi:hypothetical protein